MDVRRLRRACSGLVAVLLANPAGADIDLRVESHPNADPIEAFVRVTDGSGSVQGLTAADFAVTLDGAPLSGFIVGLPPDQDPSQRTSIAFVVADTLVRSAVADFINQMSVGDYAAVIRLKPTGFRCCAAGGESFYVTDPVVQPFTQVDGGLGTSTLVDFATTSFTVLGRVAFTRQLVALNQAVEQFVSPPVSLPDGPKAIVLVGNLRWSYGLGGVMAAANASGIPIFTVSANDLSTDAAATALMASIAADSGGHYFPARTDEEITAAFATVAGLLSSAYRLAIPDGSVTDCNLHMLEVTSRGQSASVTFTRCDSTPDDFQFTQAPGTAEPGALVQSNTVTITGIESPVAISVTGGEYSIGCGATFTSAPGFVLPDSEVCVRHSAAADPGAWTETVLVVGGVSSSFWSTTTAPPPPPPEPPPPPPSAGGGGGGGGGATGVVELMLALGALLARRRRSVGVHE